LKEKKADTKKFILDIARSEFAAKGYYATSMTSIVKSTGLSKGAIYWHFKSKLDLFSAVLREQINNTKSIIFSSDSSMKNQGLKEFFLEKGEQLIDYHLSNRENALLWLHINLEAQRGKTDIADLARDLLDSLVDELVEKIVNSKPDYGVKERSLRELVLFFRTILNGLLLDFQLKQNPELAKKFWRFLINTLMWDAEAKNEKGSGLTCRTLIDSRSAHVSYPAVGGI